MTEKHLCKLPHNPNVIDENVLTRYVCQELTTPTEFKIKQSLYLLFAYYSASYGRTDNTNYPSNLFNGYFVRGKQGILIKLNSSKPTLKGKLVDYLYTSLKVPEKYNIELFLNNILSQIDQIDDWTLGNIVKSSPVFNDVPLNQRVDNQKIKDYYFNLIQKQED